MCLVRCISAGVSVRYGGRLPDQDLPLHRLPRYWRQLAAAQGLTVRPAQSSPELNALAVALLYASS